MDGGIGADTLIGGTGNDSYTVDSSLDVVTEAANEGTDTVYASIDFTLGANLENLTLTGSSAINGTGNTFNNTITGNSTNNTLSGSDGNDTLSGGDGNDTLNGGSGADQFRLSSSNNAFAMIQDFSDAEGDSIQIGSGDSIQLKASQFMAGAGIRTATTLGQRVLYDTDNGDLFYDADGSGIQFNSVHIATLANQATLNTTNIYIEPKPLIAIELQQDTGTNNIDRLTSNAAIQGNFTMPGTGVQLSGSFNGTTFVPVTATTIDTDGNFTLDPAQLAQINGGSLPNGDYTLSLKASDSTGNISNVATFFFRLQAANDAFADAIILTGSTGSVTGSNVNATGEDGEPAQSSNVDSVWWTWVAPSNGTLVLNTSDSNFYPFLSLFTGSSVDGLTVITRGFDSLEHRVESGVTYYIASDGYGSEEGDFELDYNLTSGLVNDDFVNAIALTGTSGTAYGSNIGATEENGEPGQSSETNSVWWTWTAPSDGTLVLDTNGSNYDTYLSLFASSSLASLTTLAQDDDSGDGSQSRIEYEVQAGTVHYIAVDGYGDNIGDITLQHDFIPLSIVGTTGNDSLLGGIGRQTIQGLEGDDLLNGLEGNDTLEGGAGADQFEISQRSYSIIQDFSSTEGDIIQVGTGNSSTLLQANQFLAGADVSAATTPDHRVLYNTSTRQLFYDADGSYSYFSAVHIATLANNAALNASDIYLAPPM